MLIMLPDDARNFPTQIYSCDHLLLCFTSYHISLETGKKRDTRPGRGHTLGCFFDIGCQYRIRDWKHTVSSGGWEEFDPVPATLYPGLGNVWWRRSERLVFRLRLTHIESSTKRKTNTVHFSHPNYGRPVGYETTSCWQGFAYNAVLSTFANEVGWQIQNSVLLIKVIIPQQNRFQPDWQKCKIKSTNWAHYLLTHLVIPHNQGEGHFELHVEVHRKRIFPFLPKCRKRTAKNFSFCRNTERTERHSFCRKSLFRQKEAVSAEISFNPSNLSPRCSCEPDVSPCGALSESRLKSNCIIL